jgi:hypothetical protein
MYTSTMALYVRNLSIHGFRYLQRVLEPTPSWPRDKDSKLFKISHFLCYFLWDVEAIRKLFVKY